MQKAILARKLGMTQVFKDDGDVVPVTVLEAGPCVVIQKKLPEKEGYRAIQVGFGDVKERRVSKPLKGHFKRAEVHPKEYIREFRLDNVDDYKIGQEIKVGIFKPGEFVDVTGVSKGKGFAGAIKRHGQSRGPMTHGSRYHRGPGSLGSIDPARVFKGQTLPGRMGNRKTTVQKLEVVKVDADNNLLLVKGAVPGPKGAVLVVKDSSKANRKGGS